MKPVTILYIVLALIVGFGAGYLVFRGSSPTTSSLDNEQAPIPASRWNNQVVTSWLAGVEGNLTGRNQNSFTLSNGSDSITLPLTKDTTFKDRRDFTKQIDFTTVPFGTIVKGSVNIDREKGVFTWGTYSVQFE